MCLLKAVGNYPILREIDASGFKSFCSDKAAMIVLSCIRKQVKRYTPMLLPEERRAIMRKAKTRKSNEVDREVEALAKKEGVTKDDVARAPTKLNLKSSAIIITLFGFFIGIFCLNIVDQFFNYFFSIIFLLPIRVVFFKFR